MQDLPGSFQVEDDYVVVVVFAESTCLEAIHQFRTDDRIVHSECGFSGGAAFLQYDGSSFRLAILVSNLSLT